jgi:diguanylate cyclase (GGDEF)-like protein
MTIKQDHISAFAWLRALAQPFTYLGIVMLVTVYATLTYLLVIDRVKATDDATQNAENLARLIEQSVARAIRSADNTVLILRRSYLRDPANTDLVAWATDPDLKNGLTFQYSVINRDGLIKSSSYGRNAVGIDVSDRAHFQVHAESKDDTLYISEPIRLRSTGQNTIILSRRISNPDGSFAGVITASFDIDQLVRLYQSINLGKNGIISLIGRDGIVRAAGANGQPRWDVIGQRFPNAGILEAIEKSPSGQYWNEPQWKAGGRRFDGVKRLIAYRCVEDLPLVAVVGISEDEIFQHSTDNALAYLSISGILTIGILIAIAFAAIRQRKLMVAAREVEFQAYHDGMTALANRTAFRRAVDRALRQSKISGSNFNIFLLDLDNFKNVNDTLGHIAGDDLIRQVADRLKSAVGTADLVARIGGDEFAILQIPNGDSRNAALTLAGKLIELIGTPYDLDGHEAIVETSIGIAQSRTDGADTDQLVNSADLALYHAKAAGRNIFHMFEAGMAADARSRYELQNELRRAITRDEFEVYYQPLVDTRTMKVCGAEALLRWNHPRRGIVAPDAFIPIAESTGLIMLLGELVLRQACRDAAHWPRHIKVAVNLSPVQFRKGDVVAVVAAALEESGLDPKRLELEITESVLLAKDDSNLAKLHKLKQIGISIALDDFGTGYSSLSYLHTFPFDKIKIDRSFIAEITTRSDSAAIVCAVAGLAKSLDVTITAEGVETPEQFHLLRAAGCHQAQGYLFGRPRPALETQIAPLPEQSSKASAA